MDELEALIYLRKIIRAVHLEDKRMEKTYGVSIPQLLILQFLSKQPSFTSKMGDLNNAIHLNSSTITSLISNLMKKNLVLKLPKEKDKRVTKVMLTALGAKLIDESPALLQNKLTSAIPQLSAAELIRLQQSFENIVEFLKISEKEASSILAKNPET